MEQYKNDKHKNSKYDGSAGPTRERNKSTM